jgi:hypothetical protein
MLARYKGTNFPHQLWCALSGLTVTNPSEQYGAFTNCYNRVRISELFYFIKYSLHMSIMCTSILQ